MTSLESRPNMSKPLQGEAALVHVIGFTALTAAIINIIVGAGIFVLPALLAKRMGAAAPIAFVAGAFVIVPVALCFAAIGSRATRTGGPYTYVGAGFGPFAGFIAGALMWICNVASSAGVAVALSDQIANAFPAFSEAGIRYTFFATLYAALIALNAFGVKLGARAIVVLASLKLTPLFILATVGLFFVDWSQVSWIAIPSWTTLGASMVLVMFAYSGMETALIPSGEVRDPVRQVPRATFAGILIVVLLYVAIQVVCQGVLGPALPSSTASIADSAGRLWSPGHALLLITACVSMTGFLMGNLLATSRVLFALGRDGYLPSVYGRVTARYRVPLLAIVTHGVIACALALGGSFEKLALISGGANCLLYLGVCAASWRTQYRDLRGDGAPFVLPGGIVIPLVACVAMVAVLATLSRAEWMAIGVALVVLIAIYAVLRQLRTR